MTRAAPALATLLVGLSCASASATLGGEERIASKPVVSCGRARALFGVDCGARNAKGLGR